MSAEVLKGRYEKRGVLGEGGMGVVYRAWDRDLKREIALKTLRDAQDPAAIEMFRKECGILASLNHPNIVDIYDVGELDEGGGRKPYFVMPLLPGMTLERMIDEQPQRLTPERVVEIAGQVCRGLQAAHERGLVHRDLKPSNIFVLGDDAVKIIDFGIAHLSGQQTTAGMKGTLTYMSPEQVELKPATPLSDIFALGVVCFEALTRRRPFDGKDSKELMAAIRKAVPPPAAEINPGVNAALSQVVHAAMAKQPFHRYPSAREFADCLQKALRNQALERFDGTRIAPRIERVEKAVASGEFEFASEILTELEEEGFLHPSIRPLRKRIDQSTRDRVAAQLIETARRRLADHETKLALQKVQEVLDLDPQNGAALALKAEIESRRGAEEIQKWFQIARQHLDNQAFGEAREALQNVLRLKPGEPTAMRLLADLARSEQDFGRTRREKESHYQTALEMWQRGELTSALSEIEKVLEMDRQSPEVLAADRVAAYQDLFNRVRGDHDGLKRAYAEAQSMLAGGDYQGAARLCEPWSKKYPGNALLQSLQFDIGEKQRQALSVHIARVDREVEGEGDLDRKARLLEEALKQFPGESHFERSLKVVASKRDLVNSIVAKARDMEERGQYQDALGQWDILRNIYAQYPGLEFEHERVDRRRQQQTRVDAKARWVDQIDGAINLGDAARAIDLVQRAMAEFPGDAELAALDKLARQTADRAAESQRLIDEGRQLCEQNRFPEGIDTLWKAHTLDTRNTAARAALVHHMVRRAEAELERNPAEAETLIEKALGVEPQHPKAKSLQTVINDRKRDDSVARHLTAARERQAAGDITGAIEEVDRGLTSYPQDARLQQLRSRLRADIEETIAEPAARSGMPVAAPRVSAPQPAAPDPSRQPGRGGEEPGVRQPPWVREKGAPAPPEGPPAQRPSRLSPQPESPVKPAASRGRVEAQAAPARKPAGGKSGSNRKAILALLGVVPLLAAAVWFLVSRQGAQDTQEPAPQEQAEALPPPVPAPADVLTPVTPTPAPAPVDPFPPPAPGVAKPVAKGTVARKGAETPAAVQPTPQVQPAPATLVIVGAPPSAQVVLDGRPAGSVNAEGLFQTQVEPGRRQVGLRLKEHDATDRTFESRAGEEIRLSGRELLVRQTVAQKAPPVPAKGPDQAPVTAPKPAARAAAQSSGMADWEGPWKQEREGWHTIGRDQRGWFKLRANGVASFQVQRKGLNLGFLSRSKAQWVAGFADASNYVLFELDNDSLACSQVTRGNRKKVKEVKVSRDAEDIRVDITPGRVSHTVGGATFDFDLAGVNLTEGRFGFFGPVGIRGFEFRGR